MSNRTLACTGPYVRFFIKILNETNVNISNELNFSDV